MGAVQAPYSLVALLLGGGQGRRFKAVKHIVYTADVGETARPCACFCRHSSKGPVGECRLNLVVVQCIEVEIAGTAVELVEAVAIALHLNVVAPEGWIIGKGVAGVLVQQVIAAAQH